MISLISFLKNKTLYYDKIDYEIIKLSWNILKNHIKLPFVIHIIGTNGKGSTSRFLAHYLYKKHYKVLHYSSPHIFKLNERIWINGSNSTDETLELAHIKLQDLLDKNLLAKLTYFEYMTLLALILSKDMDYILLEAGLGGEFDATNVVKNDLTLVTPIDFDHQDFLGNTIRQIASTKLRSCDTKMILSHQAHKEVYDIAYDIKKNLYLKHNKKIDIKILKDINKYTLKKKFALYLMQNLHLAIEAIHNLQINLDLELFEDVEIFARFYKFRKNIIIDVGHNVLAAQALYEELKDKKIILIYNSYVNKDYKQILSILKPIIREIFILEIKDKRIVNKEILVKTCQELELNIKQNISFKDDEEYLVFGSFLTVEKFLSINRNL